ncbi:MAG: chromosome segregation SMC family protein [Candidatus Hadarchaeales archaeon]
MPHISKIEMRGFKSFGNSKVTLPLSKGLTAVVGPNGNGKSNIVDALCFVLGELSAKTMRAEKLSDLLFKGNDNGQRPAPFAEVTLVFNNEDGKIPVGSKDVAVSRWIDRHGKCVYKINGKRVTRQDIIDLLAPVMSSPGGYNFVMQGDVSSFINMTPLERRLIIDELSGVKEYDEKKAKSVEELKAVEANLSTVGAVLKEISSRMENLKSQVEVAIKHRTLTAELEQLRGEIAVIKRDRIAGKLSALERKIDRLHEDLKKARARADGIEGELNGCKSKIEELSSKIEEMQSDSAIESTTAIHSKITTLQGLLESYRNRRSSLERDLADIDGMIQKVTEEVPDTGSLISKFRELHGRFTQLMSSMGKKTREQVMEALKETRGVLDEISSVLTQLERYIANYRTYGSEAPSLADMRAKREGLARSLAEVRTNIAEIEEKMTAARSEEEKLSEAEKKVRASINRLRSEREKLRSELQALESKKREIDARVRELEGEKQGHELQRASMKAELEAAEAEIKKLRSGTSAPKEADLKALENRAEQVEEELRSLGEVNQRAIRDYKEEEKKFGSEKARYDKLVAEKESILDFMRRIDEKKKEVFMKTFNEISYHFGQIFSEISVGGVGRLTLQNQESPFEGGVEIYAEFPKKEFISLGSLSGGEKAITALTLIFALQRYRPTTFYVLDEIDANLDPRNRGRVAEMLKKFSRDSQILVITLHDAIMSSADRIFGIAMENNISRVFSVDLEGLGG